MNFLEGRDSVLSVSPHLAKLSHTVGSHKCLLNKGIKNMNGEAGWKEKWIS